MKRRDPATFFAWLTQLFVVAVWYVSVRYFGPKEGPLLVAFTGLMLLHGALHFAVGWAQARGWGLWYILTQLAVTLALVVMAEGNQMIAGLFFPLAGEAFGLFTDLKHRLAILGGLLATWAMSMVLTNEWAEAMARIPATVAALAFVATYVILFTRQSQEKQRAESLLAQLETAHSQLRTYSVQVEELTIAQERQRMARELHDTLAQGLAGLVMQLEAVDDLLERGDGQRARQTTARALERARTTLREARLAIQALRNPTEQGSLIDAVARLVDGLRTDSGIACTLELGPGEVRLAGRVGEQVYRVVQEGLANVARHSGASQAAVRLWSEDGQLCLEIQDDGRGFALDAVPIGHFGLLGLRERIRTVGGHLSVESSPGNGTRLLAAVPLAAETSGNMSSL